MRYVILCLRHFLFRAHTHTNTPTIKHSYHMADKHYFTEQQSNIQRNTEREREIDRTKRTHIWRTSNQQTYAKYPIGSFHLINKKIEWVECAQRFIAPKSLSEWLWDGNVCHGIPYDCGLMNVRRFIYICIYIGLATQHHLTSYTLQPKIPTYPYVAEATEIEHSKRKRQKIWGRLGGVWDRIELPTIKLNANVCF